jgi:hypothetical protein
VNISHNIIKNGINVSGIWVRGKFQNIVDNSLDNIGGHGIYISTGAENAYVAGNYINRASNQAADIYRPIRVTANYCIVENNYIFDANKQILNFSPKTTT